jgi:4-alpha-glucanotransferase
LKESEVEALEELARVAGLQISYEDIRGQTQEAEPEALLAVLKAIGWAVDGARDAKRALDEAVQRRWRFGVEPCVVAWEGAESDLELRLPARAFGRLECRLGLEDGTALEWSVTLEDLPAGEIAELRGERFVARRLRVPEVPLGFHPLTLKHRDFEARVLVIAAPARAYQGDGRKRRGYFAPLYGLRSARSWGAGDLIDLRSFAAWAKGRGGDFVATLPMLPTFLGDAPYSPSPYSPVSRLFWNELYADPAAVTEWYRCEPAHAWLNDPQTQGLLERLRSSLTIDYRGVFDLKRAAFARLAACEPPGAQGTDDVLMEYARFRAAHERYGKSWRLWPEKAAGGALTEGDYDRVTFETWLLSQLATQEQVAEFGKELRAQHQMLYIDLPIGSHPDGFDTWKFRGVFADGVSAGAPPDSLFTHGQDWGLPPQMPEEMRRSGFEYFRKVLAHHVTHADILRFDHVIGLHRLFWVPEGFSARQGVFVRYPAEELYAVLSLVSHRSKTLIVGENLGTVPPEVNEAMHRHGIYETYVLQYEVPAAPGGAIRKPPRSSFASINTHDMPPFAAFLSGSDIEDRKRLGISDESYAQTEREERAAQLDNLRQRLSSESLLPDEPTREELLEAATQFLAGSDAEFVTVNVEDLWLELRPQNIPGTTEGNWERRLAKSLEELQDVQAPA